MQELSGSVGENGANARHDVALVQAMLVVTGRPVNLDATQAKYLTAIDGDCGNKTKGAIRQFQYDQVFVSPTGGTSQAVAGAEAGIIRPADVTWRKLVAAVPKDFGDLRVLERSKTVYIAATTEQFNNNRANLGQLTFEAGFRGRVNALLQTVYDKYGIAIAVCPDGDRRTFQKQYELLTSVDAQGRPRNVTRSGPGESNHNFGQAVDLGFQRLRWLRTDGTVVENETHWLHRLDPAQTATGEALLFWEAMRSEGIAGGLFRGPLADRPHLQAWNDAGIDMASRLADLLTRSGRMRWAGRNQRYECDLGFRGRMFAVGTAAQIWNRQATVTVAMLNEARAQQQAPGRAVPAFAGPLVGPPVPRAGGPTAGRAGPPPVTQREVEEMKQALRADFEAADANWTAWRAS